MNSPPLATAFATAFRRPWGWVRRHPLLTLSVLPLLAIGYAVALVAAIVPSAPGTADIRNFKVEQPSVVLSADGQELATFRRVNREWVKLQDISPHVLAALIATEDRRFFEHHGLDAWRTISAALHTLRGDLQGGSTITQQLARNLFPEDIGRAPTLTRKIKEAITALRIESVHSKQEILETYLNTVPFLYNAYGIEMAARTYFDTSASQLDELQSATLIGMLKGTRYYNPVLNPERSLQRRNAVLARMAQAGKLEPARLEALRKQPLALDFQRQAEDAGPAPHLAQHLRQWLIEWGDRNGYNINADGLVVRTTIDSRLQAMAEQAVTRQADKLQKAADGTWKRGAGWKAYGELADTFVRETPEYQAAVGGGTQDAAALKKLQSDPGFMQALWEGKTRLQAGFLALDPASGQVKAWIGSRDFEQDKFDHVQQARRQPGSTFKPFVYGAAFEQGISPFDTFIDQPVEIRIDDKTVWRPGDVAPPSGLPMSLRDGLALSRNSITSQLMQRVGPDRVAQLAWNMGVRQSKLDQVPSLALGTSPVTLKEMVSAFGTIANGGRYVEPVLVTRIEDRNHRVIQQFAAPAPERALSARADEILLDVMRGVVDRGTGAGIRSRFGIQGDVAGKTGTTQSNTDGWFILMHPQLVGGAWVGFNDNRVTMRGDAWGQGAHNALNIVGDFFQQTIKAKAIDAKAKFAAPRLPEPPPVDPSAADPNVVDPGSIDPNAVDPNGNGQLMGRVNGWFGGMFGRAEARQPPPQQPPAAAVEAAPAIVMPAPEHAVAAQPQLPPSLQRVPEIRRVPVPLQMDRSGQIVIAPPVAMPPQPVPRPDTAESGAGPAIVLTPGDGATGPLAQ